MALHTAVLKHEALHVCRSMPDGNEKSNTSPAAVLQLENMPRSIHDASVTSSTTGPALVVVVAASVAFAAAVGALLAIVSTVFVVESVEVVVSVVDSGRTNL